MLIVYNNLALGGIETFFVRLAKQRAQSGKTTKIILLMPRESNDASLLAEMQKYAEVYFFDDIFRRRNWLNWRYYLCHPFNRERVSAILEGVQMIHVTAGAHLLLVERMFRAFSVSMPVTVGVYHTQEFVWKHGRVPYFDQVHRRYFHRTVPAFNKFCFAETSRQYIAQVSGENLDGAQVFRLGVVESQPYREDYWDRAKPDSRADLRICAVGRLVSFKAYNLWMMDVVRQLVDAGVNVTFDIYGTGPLEAEMQARIAALGIERHVRLMGNLNYFDFNAKVSSYDLFIGSGTAIVQAAWLGVPSIIGIESETEPVSYGYFSDYYMHEYHHRDLGFAKRPVAEIIQDFLALPADQVQALSRAHFQASQPFNMDACDQGFSLPFQAVDFSRAHYNTLLYYASRTLFFVVSKSIKLDVYDVN